MINQCISRLFLFSFLCEDSSLVFVAISILSRRCIVACVLGILFGDKWDISYWLIVSFCADPRGRPYCCCKRLIATAGCWCSKKYTHSPHGPCSSLGRMLPGSRLLGSIRYYRLFEDTASLSSNRVRAVACPQYGHATPWKGGSS